MKKIFICALFIFTIAMGSFNTLSVSATSDSSQNIFAHYYMQNIVCQEYNVCSENLDMNIKKEVLYDIYLEKLGFVYNFEVTDSNIEGYLILKRVKNENGWEYSVVEFGTDTKSPYNEKNSKNIYLGFGMYLEYKNDTITDVINGEEYIYSDVLSILNTDFELVYPTGVGAAYYEDPVTYDFYYMEESETLTDYGYPLMDVDMGYSNHYNNCSPTAGVSIALYWDYYFPNLVPNVYPIQNTSNGYVYKDYDYYVDSFYYPYDLELTYVRSLHSTFYADMHTNSYVWLATPSYRTINTGIGTVPSWFFDELEEYFDNANLNLQHYDIIESADDAWGFIGESMTSTNWTQYKAQINLNRPVVIQLGLDWSVDFTLIRFDSNIVEDSTSISYTYREYPSMNAHTVVGYGYRTYTLYSYEQYVGIEYGSTIHNFMVVANGWGGTSYINASDNDIGMAYSVYPD